MPGTLPASSHLIFRTFQTSSERLGNLPREKGSEEGNGLMTTACFLQSPGFLSVFVHRALIGLVSLSDSRANQSRLTNKCQWRPGEIGKSDMVRDWGRKEDSMPSASFTVEKARHKTDVTADKKPRCSSHLLWESKLKAKCSR